MDIFTDTQLQTLHAAMDVLIPPDDNPGAVDAGAADYLVRQLQGDLSGLLPLYQSSLDSLDKEAHVRFRKPLAAASAQEINSLLFALEADLTQTVWEFSPSQFLNLLVHHTAEGYYSDPGNGGNRDERSWKMIGFR